MTVAQKKYILFGKELTGEEIAALICKVLVFAVFISYILKAFTGVYYHEIDSYVLPSVSMQYRHSLIITQEDIDRAKIDFPKYYEKVEDYDSLRSSQLVKITDDKWLSYYFPLYAMLCLPLKIIFQLAGINQIRAFTVTNAVFVMSALIYLYRKLDVSFIYKQLAVLLFVISPIHMYIEYVSAEAVMFSMITIALVMYSNKRYRFAAVMISIASMPNPTVMAVGIVMVAAYFVKMFSGRKEVKIFSRGNIFDIIKYGCCYVPCLIPFAFNLALIGSANPTASGATTADYGARLLSYFFDVNLGFFSFAPLTLIAFAVLTAVSLRRRNYDSLIYAGFLIAPVLAYSFMIYINCVPVFCVRYVMWTYPSLLIGTVLTADKIIREGGLKYAVGGILAAASAAMLAINNIPMYYFGFNGMSTFLLENMPALYKPYHATFYASNDMVNWPYEIDFPSYYFSQKDGSLRKMLFKSTDAYKEEVLSSLKGSESSMNKFSRLVNKIPSDGKFHYINISPLSDIELREKSSEDCGLIVENEVILQVDDSFVIGNSVKEFETEIIPGAVYKLELEFEDKYIPNLENTFIMCVDDFNHTLRDFTHTGKSTYSVIFSANSYNNIILEKIFFYSKETVKINSFSITLMTNTSSLTISDEPVKFSGGSAEDEVLYPVSLMPRAYYIVDIDISDNGRIAEDDEVYCTVYYEKRYNSYDFPQLRITDTENRFYIYPWDTTIATGPLYIKIYGKTADEIEIESVRLEAAE